MLHFVISILSFVWRTGSMTDPQQRAPLSPNGALIVRIAITTQFSLGMVFMLMIVKTLRSYSAHEKHLYPTAENTPNVYRDETRTSARASDIESGVEQRGRARVRSGEKSSGG